MSHPLLTSVRQLALGTDPRQRRHLSRFLLSACVYAFSLALQWHVSTWDNFVWLHGVKPFATGVGLTIVVFYVDAHTVVERVRQRLSNVATWTDQPELRVTFSGGITAHRDGEDMQDTIARAEMLLYRAKDAGRDRVLQAA